MFIWTGEFKQTAKFVLNLKSMNASINTRKITYFALIKTLKITLLSLHASSPYSSQQYLHYSPLAVLLSIL